MLTAYQVLGAPPRATDAELRARWRALSAQYHPDRGASADVEKFHAVQEAYGKLRTSELRRRYDQLFRAPLCRYCNGIGALMSFGKTKTCSRCMGTGYEAPKGN